MVIIVTTFLRTKNRCWSTKDRSVEGTFDPRRYLQTTETVYPAKRRTVPADMIRLGWEYCYWLVVTLLWALGFVYGLGFFDWLRSLSSDQFYRRFSSSLQNVIGYIACLLVEFVLQSSEIWTINKMVYSVLTLPYDISLSATRFGFYKTIFRLMLTIGRYFQCVHKLWDPIVFMCKHYGIP